MLAGSFEPLAQASVAVGVRVAQIWAGVAVGVRVAQVEATLHGARRGQNALVTQLTCQGPDTEEHHIAAQFHTVIVLVGRSAAK